LAAEFEDIQCSITFTSWWTC